MATTSPKAVTCPACGFAAGTDRKGLCSQCGADLSGPAARAVIQADLAIDTLQKRYESLAFEWRRWAEYRDYYVKQVIATVPAAESRVAEDPELSTPLVPTPEPVSQGFAEPAMVAEPDAVPVQASAAAPSAATASVSAPAPAPAVPTAAAPTEAPAAPKPQRRASAAFEALTAPALLGVAGASLLVAAAIVFVALAWTSFSPVARGTVVLAVGFVVAGISVWVKRLGLIASSGAIGVVAMGFAGVATIAYLRDSGSVGSFDAAAALLVAAIAGLVLSRFAIPWVGSAAALSMAASVASFTFAATATADRSAEAGGSVGAMPIWIVAGTGAASALAASHRFWRWTVAKSVVAWASVVWLSVVGLSVPIWIWGGDGGALEGALGLLPVLALAIIAMRWQLLATGPAAFLFSVMVPAIAAAQGASVWAQAAASAAAVTAVLALGRWLPRKVLRPLFAGVAPAYAVVAVASAGYAVSITVGRIVAGTYVPDTQLWAGVAALLCGLAIATLRLWRLEWTVLRFATSVGAIMVAVGAGITAFGIAELTGPPYYHSSVAIALVVAAIGLVAMTRVWWERDARAVSELGALAFLLTAAVHAYWALVISEFALALSLLIVIEPLVVFAFRARSAMWWSVPFLTAGVTALAPALVARYGLEAPIQAFALVAGASVIAWTAWRLPREFHVAIASGLAPALAVGGFTALASVRSTVQTLVESSVEAGRSAWLDAAALALALALATWHRWQLPALAHRAIPISGAAVVLASGAGFAVSAAGAWGVGLEGAVPLWILVGALAVLPFTLLWREPTAAWVNGVGSAALSTLAGANGLGYVAVPSNPLWLPLGVALGAIAVLGVGAARWPVVSLAPAVALSTGLGLVLALRADAGAMEALSVAAAIGAVALWIPLRGLRRSLVAVGAALALLAGAVVAAIGVGGAMLEIAHLAPADGSSALGWFTLLSLAATVAAVLACPSLIREWRADGRHAPWRATVLSSASLALVGVVLGTMIAVTAFVAGLSWADASTATIVRTGTGALAAVLVAMTFSAGLQLVVAHPLSRRIARIGAAAWIALITVVAGAEAWSQVIEWEASVGAFAIGIVTLALWTIPWRRSGVAALVGVVTAIPLVLVAASVFSSQWGIATAAGIGACIAWFAASAPVARVASASAIRLGLVPVAVFTLPAAVGAVGMSFRALAQHVVADAFERPDPWWGVTLVAVAAGVLSVESLRRFGAAVAAGTVALALGGAGPLASVIVLLALHAALVWAHRRLPMSAKSAAIAAAGALAWAIHDWLLIAIVAAVTVASGFIVLRRTHSKPPALVTTGIPVLSALGAAAACLATQTSAGTWATGPTAMVAVLLAGGAVWQRVDARSRDALTLVLAGATFVLPIVASALAPAGATLLIASVGWIALTARGVAAAKWFAAASASVGVALIAYDAGVGAIEAYTLAPAVSALALGVYWMNRSKDVSSLAALTPGLAIALVPSYLALLSNPDSLARTTWLTALMVVFALVGMNRRWFAPVAATAVTAILVAVLQVVVGTNLVYRLIAFLIVGTLLLVAASWFDKIKALR